MFENRDRLLAYQELQSFRQYLPGLPGGRVFLIIAVLATPFINACSTRPLEPYSADTPPLILVPVSYAGVADKRARFREIFCEILKRRKSTIPDYRSCDEALTRVGAEPPGAGREVDLGKSERRLVAAIVPGIGWDCFEEWLDLKGGTPEHVRQFGYDLISLKVDGLSSSSNNARQIRDAILQMSPQLAESRLVLIGYSKGIADILEAVVAYPEIRQFVAAVVSAAGSVGGSPMANHIKQSQISLVRYWPGAECSPGDGGAIESLLPSTRKAWLAQNRLPRDFPYYSLATFPQPERISSILKPSYRKLGRADGRNDSQILFYDQVIPGSALIGYLNADHWALTVPIARSHKFLGSTFVNQNDFPREALLEAILRFIEEDLALSGK